MSVIDYLRWILTAWVYDMAIRTPLHLMPPGDPVRHSVGGSRITFDGPQGRSLLRIPVVDDQLHPAAVVPLDGAIRVAGTAEFAGYDLALPRPAFVIC